ncbi:condensation domain-containing protein [Prescottella defluvii]|nr:condensation domain-containing protein [Prescottella defluvii]
MVKSVKEQLLAVPDHGIGYGLLRYLNEDTGPVLRDLPEPQIAFNYLGRVAGGIHDGGREAGWLPVADAGDLTGAQNPDMPVPAVLDINAFTLDDGGGPRLRAIWSFPSGVLTAREVGAAARMWRDALVGLAAYVATPGRAGGPVGSRPGQARAIGDRTARGPVSEHDGCVAALAAAGGAAVPRVRVRGVVGRLRGAVGPRAARDVDPARLRRAGQVLLERHPNLRTAFVPGVTGGPVQVVQDHVVAPWSVSDLSGRGDDERNRAWDRLMSADRATRFDPAQAPLLRWMLVTTGPECYRLVLTNHHLLLDGWSTPLVLRELLLLYATDGDSAMLPRIHPYRDYLTWIGGQDETRSLETWARAFHGADEPTLVAPADPGRRYSESRDVLGGLTEERTAALTALVRARGVTLNTVVQAAWAIVLGAWTSRDDVTFGATVSGRPSEVAGVESMIGLFVNTLPVRVRLDTAESLGQLLDRIQAEQAGLLDHHHVTLADVQRVAGPGAVFDTMTVFESYPVDRGGLTAETDIAGMRVVDVSGTDASHYPIGLVAHVDTRLHLRISYLPELFDRDTIDATLQRVLRVIDAVVADPDLSPARLDLLSSAERGEVVPVSGGLGVSGRVLPELLSASVVRIRCGCGGVR